MKKRLRIEYFLVAAVMLLLFVGSIAATNFFFQKEMVAQQETYLRRKNTLLTDQLPPSVFEKGQLTNQQQLLVTHALDDAEERVTLLQKNGTVTKNDLKSLRFYQELPMVQLYERVKR